MVRASSSKANTKKVAASVKSASSQKIVASRKSASPKVKLAATPSKAAKQVAKTKQKKGSKENSAVVAKKKPTATSTSASHPSMEMNASRGITKGQPLKFLLDSTTVRLIGKAFRKAYAKFDESAFVAKATAGLDALELSPRSLHIAGALAATLPPSETAGALDIFIAALGPKSAERPEGCGTDGLGSFFYYPYAHFLQLAAKDLPPATKNWSFTGLMRANYELTQRFTSEFCIRALIEYDQQRALNTLSKWTTDPSADVRRLVSEGTRPRLPWGSHLTAFKKDPAPILPLLEKLRGDSSLYVRRSVANSMGDIAKDSIGVALKTCDKWMSEAIAMRDRERGAELRWVVRHALRNPIKNGNAKAIAICARWK